MHRKREALVEFIYRIATGPESRRRRLAPFAAAFFVALVAGLIGASLLADLRFGTPPFPFPSLLTQALAVVLFASGCALWAWSAMQFRETRGTPVPLAPPPVLIQTGPYRHVRNPMLEGVFLMIAGIGVFAQSWFLLFLFLPLFIAGSVLEFRWVEEPELEKRLGPAYGRYRSETPMFIPKRRGGRFLILAFPFFQLIAPAIDVPGTHVEKIRLPVGFHISIYASGVKGARSMALGPGGVVFVGTRSEGKVYAVVDANGDGKADEIITMASGLEMPNGVAFRDGSLYVSEVSRILRFDNIMDRLRNPPRPVVVSSAFPKDRQHGWKYIAFGPDGLLYVPVGAPCNICERKDPRYASIMRMNPDGSGLSVFASGIRNTVGFDWHPVTGELWFTDNGRDWMGDDQPPDELNTAPKPGMHFGFPYCHGGDIPDPTYGKGKSCSSYTPPAIKLGPHVAALGMKFYTGKQFPADYRNQIFIAEHGSWNRTTPIGYRITRVRLEGNRAIKYETFAEGWLQGITAWGRPVDVLVMPDGALLVSDDRADAIYRITYREGQR